MSASVVSAQLGMSYVLGAAFCLGAALAGPVIEIALGPKWSDAAPLFAILAFGGVFQVMGYVYYWSFLACGLTGLQLRYSLVTRLFMIGLIIVGAFYGPTGTALAVSVSLALNWCVLSAFPMRRTGMDVREIVRTGARGIAVNVVMAVAVWGVDASLVSALAPLARVAIGLSVGILTYAVIATLISPVRKDLIAIFHMVKRSPDDTKS